MKSFRSWIAQRASLSRVTFSVESKRLRSGPWFAFRLTV